MRTQQSVRISINTTITIAGNTATTDMSGTVRDPAGPQAAASLKAVQTGGPDEGTTETVMLAGAVYVKTDGEPYEPGKPWLRITPEDLAKPDLGGTRKYFQSAYNEAQQGLREASANKGLTALRLGKLTRQPVWETLGSTKVRRYEGSTDAATLAERTNDAQFKAIAAAGVRDIPWAVWIDQQALLRQATQTLTSSKTSITTKAVYSGWGESANIAPPPADQTATLNP